MVLYYKLDEIRKQLREDNYSLLDSRGIKLWRAMMEEAESIDTLTTDDLDNTLGQFRIAYTSNFYGGEKLIEVIFPADTPKEDIEKVFMTKIHTQLQHYKNEQRGI